jgi:hypothetical protein
MDGGGGNPKAATYTQDSKNRINAHTDIHTFEPTIPAFEQAKTVYAVIAPNSI